MHSQQQLICQSKYLRLNPHFRFDNDVDNSCSLGLPATKPPFGLVHSIEGTLCRLGDGVATTPILLSSSIQVEGSTINHEEQG